MKKLFIALFFPFFFIVDIALATPIVATYFGIWTNQSWPQRFRTDFPATKMNRLYIAFGKIVPMPDGHFTIGVDGNVMHVGSLVAEMHYRNPTATIFLTVRGNDDSNSYGGAANDPAFANNVLQVLDHYGLNGFDIDWESNLNKTNLNRLVTQLYAVLHAHNDKLTLDVWPYPSDAYDMQTLQKNVDQINIMSYGTGLSLDPCVDAYVQAGFPANQMIGGIETETDYNQFGGVTDTLGPNGTIVQKSEVALSRGLAGMMSWRLDNDYTSSDQPTYPTYQGATALWDAMMTEGDHRS